MKYEMEHNPALCIEMPMTADVLQDDVGDNKPFSASPFRDFQSMLASRISKEVCYPRKLSELCFS